LRDRLLKFVDGGGKALALAFHKIKNLEIPYPDWESFNISTQEL
jgi:hypothetical protein